MLNKLKILAFSMLFMIIASNSFVVFGTSEIVSGEISGEISTPISTTEPSSGETPITPEPTTSSGEISGELPSSGEQILASVAQSSSISTYKNTTVTSTMHAEIASGETNIRYVIETQPSHGTLLYEDNTVATFSYTPDRDYLGTDTFSFKLTNGTLFSNVAMVTITISENSAPVIPFYYIDLQDHWVNYSASHLAARDIIVGEKIGNRYYFKPNTITTRQDFMLYLLAITESNEDANIEIPKVTFEDAKMYPDWLLEAAKLAYAKGIIKGSLVGNKLYLNLYNNITRSEAAIMINNILKGNADSEKLTYEDKATIPSWALQAVKALTAYKIMQGDGTNLRPNSLITKAESIELSYKLLKQLEKNSWNASSGDVSGNSN
ncbi:MAG: S-layer homology domain-containing protein [Clostridia bacterium]|nr:S-layer homology domain-containing protein [Clostridia bacterium]